jgi:hypothetical protein
MRQSLLQSLAQSLQSHETEGACLRQSLLSHHQEPPPEQAASEGPAALRRSDSDAAAAALTRSAMGQAALGRKASEQGLPLHERPDPALQQAAGGLCPRQGREAAEEGGAQLLRSSLAAPAGVGPSAAALPPAGSQQDAAAAVWVAAGAAAGEEEAAEQRQRHTSGGADGAAAAEAEAGVQMRPLDVSIIHMRPLVVEGKPIYPGGPCRGSCSAVYATGYGLSTTHALMHMHPEGQAAVYTVDAARRPWQWDADVIAVSPTARRALKMT